ncbi:MAG: hypothetical protein BKP49_06400 [Treponema sp. CETP13]|nr:MAG: hypothetical protein BKP49_06400 [Treponema sp. CETP13]
MRYFDGLFVDYYSYKFRIATFIEAIVLVFFTIVLLIFRPYPVKEHYVQVFSGSCSRGFIEKTDVFQSANLFITRFEKRDSSDSLFTAKKSVLYPLQDEEFHNNQTPVILYIPQVYSSTYDVSPRLEALAKNGYTVICAEFYTDDVRLFGNRFDLKIFRAFFARRKTPKDDFSEERAIEKKALLDLMSSKYKNLYFYEPDVNEVTPLKEDFYLTRPLEAWLQNPKNYHSLRAKAECVPRMVVLDVNKKLATLSGFEEKK